MYFGWSYRAYTKRGIHFQVTLMIKILVAFATVNSINLNKSSIRACRYMKLLNIIGDI